jgi:hypothetical protein
MGETSAPQPPQAQLAPTGATRAARHAQKRGPALGAHRDGHMFTPTPTHLKVDPRMLGLQS